MIIEDFDVPGVAIPEFEGDPPWSAGQNRPLPTPVAVQPVEAYRFQPREVVEPLCLVKKPQPPPRERFIKPTEAALTLFSEALRRPIGP